MISPLFLIFAAVTLILDVQGDLIAWNRLRNNAAKHHNKRVTTFRPQNLLAQYEHFFIKNNQNSDANDFLKISNGTHSERAIQKQN